MRFNACTWYSSKWSIEHLFGSTDTSCTPILFSYSTFRSPMAEGNPYSEETLLEKLTPAKVKWLRVLRRLSQLQRSDTAANREHSTILKCTDHTVENPIPTDGSQVNELLEKIFSYCDANVTSLVIEVIDIMF